MSDYDESVGEVEEEESEISDEDDEYDEDNYYRRKRYLWSGYDSYGDDYECKRCKIEDSYKFVTINPVILTSVPKLLDMASVMVAASLWNHINVPKAVSSVSDRCTKSSTQWSTLCGNVIALTEQLPVPKPIATQIDRYVRKMANEITAWVSYHYRTVFLKDGLDKSVYSLVYHIVWYPNGTIDCVQTARSMATSVRLSDVEKFKFLCVYCLRDDMDDMSPLIYLDNALDYVSWNEDPLILYWYCYFRDELNKIPGAPINYMLHHDKVDNWPAKEYFFDQLGYDEQVREAIWLIDKHGAVYQKAVLLKLDETQRLHVHMERATKIIVNYAHPRISSRFILHTWFEARNLISPDQFLNLFRELLKTEVKGFVLTEIWTSASDNLKQHVVGVNDYEIVGKVLTEWKWRNDDDFILVLLQDYNTTVRCSLTTQRFFNNYCEKLIANSQFQRLDRLLEFCLPDADDLARFKRNFMNNSESIFFNTQCDKLLINNKFQELDQLLEFCFPDAEDLLQFKLNFVNNTKRDIINAHCERLLTNSKFQEFDQLMEFCLFDAESSRQFKLNLLNNSKRNNINMRCENLITSSNFQELDKLLKFCLPDADCLAQFKRNIAYNSESQFFDNHCAKLLMNGKFQEFDHLMEFCLFDAESSRQFKLNLLNNSKRNNINLRCEKLITSSNFQELDQLLKFCLPDADCLAQFKRNIAYNSESQFFDKHCAKLLMNGKFQEFDHLLEFCLFDAESSRQFKLSFVNNSKRNDINAHFESLLACSQFQELDRLLKFCFSGAGDIAPFKTNLVKNSKYVSNTCLKFYSSGDLDGLNTYLKQLLTPYPDVAVQFKKDLITSSQGIKMCVGLMDKFSILNGILQDVLKDAVSIMEFKKTMIFSSAAISKLNDLLSNNRLNAAQICIDRYLTSTQDRYALKKKLIGDVTKLIQGVLGKNDESYLHTVLIWLFGNENAVQEFKRTLHLDTIFIDMLKDCVFYEYHRYLTQCNFKNCSSSDFNILDRLLNWYFQSAAKVKEYKRKVIYSYSRIDMFVTLLRGNRGDMQFKAVLQWFFKNDTAEMLKFKNLGGKIANLI